MKILDLDIEHFGLFSGRAFQFNSNGFQLIAGPNEAGKSTLLQLIRELLFGFPARNPYSFSDHSGEMAATALIQLSGGMRVRFRRRKGRTNVVQGEVEGTGKEVDEKQLLQMLGSSTPELYQHVFGFSLAELATGQKSLEHANLNEALYGGGIGGLANFQKMQSHLHDEANNLFAPTAKKRTINQLITEIRSVGKELRSKTVKASDYEKLIKARDEKKQESDTLWKTLDELRRQEGHLQRLADAVSPWLELIQCERELQSLSIPEGFPTDGEVKFRALVERRDQIGDELALLDEEHSEVGNELVHLQLNPAIVEHEAEIKELAQRLSEIKGFRRDVPLRAHESMTMKADVRLQLRELNPDWDLPQLDEFRTGLAERDAIDRLRSELEILEEQRRDLSSDRTNLQDDVDELTEQVETLTESAPTAEMEKLDSRSVQYKLDLQQLEGLTEQRRDQNAEIESLCEKLSAPFGTVLDLEAALHVPMEPTVVEFQRRMQGAAEEREGTEQRVQHLQAELRQARDDLAYLDVESTVADREQLLAQRSNRDEGWKLIRRRFIDDDNLSDQELSTWLADSESDLPEKYEQEVAEADRLADQRQEESEIAAKRDHLAVAIERLSERLTAAEQDCAKAQKKLGEIEQEWRELWSSCPFEPLTPGAMLEWLRTYNQMRDKRKEVGLLIGKCAQLQQTINTFEANLRQALDDEQADPQYLLEMLKNRVGAGRDQASKRETLQKQIAVKERKLKELELPFQQLSDSEVDWKTRWSTLLEKSGLPPAWDVRLAIKILDGMKAARSDSEKAESLDQRADEMREGIRKFEEQVGRLCADLAADLAELPAEDAVVELTGRLDSAKQAARNQQGLVGDKEKLEGKIAAKKARLSSTNGEIAKLVDLAKAESETQFVEIAQAVAKHTQLTEAVDATKKQIRIACSTEDESKFHEELQTADIDSIALEQKVLKERISEAEGRYQKARDSYTLTNNELGKLDGESVAAGLSADLESRRSQLGTAVDRWAPLVLAQAMMRRAIGRFEREHQPTMLREVEQIFKQMTAGRYTSLQRKLDEHGTLLVVEHTGKTKEPHELSTGTREQLYLAIRLAYISEYCRESEPLPIVMDDVLVNFDGKRLHATIQVLRDFSESIQIIFLTCHDHVVERLSHEIPNCEPLDLTKGQM